MMISQCSSDHNICLYQGNCISHHNLTSTGAIQVGLEMLMFVLKRFFFFFRVVKKKINSKT